MGEALDKIKMMVAKEFFDLAFPPDGFGLWISSPEEIMKRMEDRGWDIEIFRSFETDDELIVEFIEPHTGDRFFAHYGGYDAARIAILSEGAVEEI